MSTLFLLPPYCSPLHPPSYCPPLHPPSYCPRLLPQPYIPFIPPREFISWLPPIPGFIKVNTDASIRSDGKVGYGVVARDEQGVWVTGCCGYYLDDQFDKHVGPKAGKVVKGEIKAILVGLLISKEKGFKQVVIESDSKKAIDMINAVNNKNMYNYSWLDKEAVDMVLECRELANEVHYCCFQHKKREGNFCADKMAELGVQGSEFEQKFEHPPDEVVPFLIADYCRFPFPRGIKMTKKEILNICDYLTK